jgi:hypothetical protein
MNATPLAAQPMSFSPWLTIWLHPRRTIQQIVDRDALYGIYLLVPLSGIASGVGNWLNAVLTDTDTWQENLLLAIGYGLVLGTIGALVSCIVLQWVAVRLGNSIPYSHLAAATFWGRVPDIACLLLFVVVFIAATLAAMLMPSVLPAFTSVDWLLLLVWSVSQIWSMVLALGALSQVMRCSVWGVIGRQFAAALILIVPLWAESTLLSALTAYYSGDGDMVIYQSPVFQTGTNPVLIWLSVAVLLVTAVVLFAMARSSRAIGASLGDSRKDGR